MQLGVGSTRVSRVASGVPPLASSCHSSLTVWCFSQAEESLRRDAADHTPEAYAPHLQLHGYGLGRRGRRCWARILPHVMDFHPGWDVGAVLRVDPDAQLSPAQGAPMQMRAYLRQAQPGRPGLRVPVGDDGKPSNLLQQFRHVHFGSHRPVPERVPAVHVPRRLRLWHSPVRLKCEEMPLGRLAWF